MQPENVSYGIVSRTIRRFYFSAACAAYQAVMMDTSVTTYGVGAAAKQSTTTGDEPMILGVTPAAVAAGTWGDVVIYGPVYCLAHTDLDVGDPLCTYTTAGMVRELVEGTDGNRLGFALTADAAFTGASGEPVISSINAALIFVQLGGGV